MGQHIWALVHSVKLLWVKLLFVASPTNMTMFVKPWNNRCPLTSCLQKWCRLLCMFRVADTRNVLGQLIETAAPRCVAHTFDNELPIWVEMRVLSHFIGVDTANRFFVLPCLFLRVTFSFILLLVRVVSVFTGSRSNK